MKYSQRIGIAAAVTLMSICYAPWSYIASKQIIVSGFSAVGTNFGKPGLVNFALCIVMLVMFVVPTVWAKRTNVFVSALNLAWSFRNYLLLSSCMMGECPEKKWGLYALIFLALVIQVMVLLPKLEVKNK